MRTKRKTAAGRGAAGGVWFARRDGITLVELLVTVALLAIVFGLLMYPLVSSFGYFRSATARADAQAVARLALDSMARELAEAMYVQLDMYDDSMVAFIPPLRTDPDDPNSSMVTPPRPDWEHAVRYWRALCDPSLNYNPGGHLGPGNTYFLARTVIGPLPDDPVPGDPEYEVPPPFISSDPWNRWNNEWRDAQNLGNAEGKANWSAINRMVHEDVDWQFAEESVGRRNVTKQPGFPYLYVRYKLKAGEIGEAEAARLYRDHVVALTPSAVEYDVSRLEFSPTVVAGEWLRPAERPEGSDYSVYRSQYPLWRLGERYTGWAQLSEVASIHRVLADPTQDYRDPFFLIYQYPYPEEPVAVAALDPDTRSVKVLDPETGEVLYDTADYPYRTEAQPIAFGVDEIDGSLRFDFPPPGDKASMQNGAPAVVAGSALEPVSIPSPVQTVYQTPLLDYWATRAGSDTLGAFLVPDSVRVRVDTDASGEPDRALSQVFCTPRDNSDQFQVGLDPRASGDATSPEPLYGWIRLPENLSGGREANLCTFYVDFRWRSNGVWIVEEGERPDLISAYYRSAAVLDISLTVTRAEAGAQRRQAFLSRWLGQVMIGQSANMTRRVNLRNILRRIRYAKD